MEEEAEPSINGGLTPPPPQSGSDLHVDLTKLYDDSANITPRQIPAAMDDNRMHMAGSHGNGRTTSMNAQASPSGMNTPLGQSTPTHPHLSQHSQSRPSLPLSSSFNGHPYPQASSSSIPLHRTVDDDNDIQITGSNIITPQIQRSHSGMINGSHHNGHGMSNGMNGFGTNGHTADSAIDLTNVRLPSPPPVKDTKKPICIGAVQSRAIVLYPSPAIVAGAEPPPNVKEKFSTIMYNGAELIKAKLKVGHAI